MAPQPLNTHPPFPDAHATILTTSELATSPHFPALYALENEAFSHAHQHGIPGKILLSGGRFEQPQDMLDELGPQAFCLILFGDSSPKAPIIGSISAKPFTLPKRPPPGTTTPNNKSSNHPRLLFKRPPPPEEPTEEQKAAAVEVEDPSKDKWELLAMAVAVRVKGRGVAGLLMEGCVGEIRRRNSNMVLGAGLERGEGGSEGEDKQRKLDGGEKKKQIVLYLSTMQELNEGYYLRRGWTTTGLRRFEGGVVPGSPDGFGIVEMVKVLE